MKDYDDMAMKNRPSGYVGKPKAKAAPKPRAKPAQAASAPKPRSKPAQTTERSAPPKPRAKPAQAAAPSKSAMAYKSPTRGGGGSTTIHKTPARSSGATQGSMSGKVATPVKYAGSTPKKKKESTYMANIKSSVPSLVGKSATPYKTSSR